MPQDHHLVFVYGTLRKGASNAFRMEGARLIGPGVVKGRIYVIEWFPAFVRKGGDGWVTGELWEVDGALLEALDRYEGEEYLRTEIEVRPENGEPRYGFPRYEEWQGEWRKAWIWEWRGEVDPERWIRSGDWMDVERPAP